VRRGAVPSPCNPHSADASSADRTSSTAAFRSRSTAIRLPDLAFSTLAKALWRAAPAAAGAHLWRIMRHPSTCRPPQVPSVCALLNRAPGSSGHPERAFVLVSLTMWPVFRAARAPVCHEPAGDETRVPLRHSTAVQRGARTRSAAGARLLSEFGGSPSAPANVARWRSSAGGGSPASDSRFSPCASCTVVRWTSRTAGSSPLKLTSAARSEPRTGGTSAAGLVYRRPRHGSLSTRIQGSGMRCYVAVGSDGQSLRRRPPVFPTSGLRKPWPHHRGDGD